MQFPKQVKTKIICLGVPAGTIGDVVSHGDERLAVSHIAVKFECKKEAVLIGYPNDTLTVDVVQDALDV